MANGRRVALDVEGIEGEIEVDYDARDMRAWESEHNESYIATTLTVTMLCWLGWHAAVRLGKLDGLHKAWERFDEDCIGVRVVPDPPKAEPGKSPTSTEAGDASSADSPSAPASPSRSSKKKAKSSS